MSDAQTAREFGGFMFRHDLTKLEIYADRGDVEVFAVTRSRETYAADGGSVDNAVLALMRVLPEKVGP